VGSGIYPLNPGMNRLELIASGAAGDGVTTFDPLLKISSDVSSDANQKSLQMFFSSANGRTVINDGLRSYGGDIGIQSQLIDIGGAINASTTGLVALMPGQAVREINLGQKELGKLGLLRSEIALITAGTVQVGSLSVYPRVLNPTTPEVLRSYNGTNPLWAYSTVDA
jgi:hypothetical protein